jgi:hypothetical protein
MRLECKIYYKNELVSMQWVDESVPNSMEAIFPANFSTEEFHIDDLFITMRAAHSTRVMTFPGRQFAKGLTHLGSSPFSVA